MGTIYGVDSAIKKLLISFVKRQQQKKFVDVAVDVSD